VIYANSRGFVKTLKRSFYQNQDSTLDFVKFTHIVENKGNDLHSFTHVVANLDYPIKFRCATFRNYVLESSD